MHAKDIIAVAIAAFVAVVAGNAAFSRVGGAGAAGRTRYEYKLIHSGSSPVFEIQPGMAHQDVLTSMGRTAGGSSQPPATTHTSWSVRFRDEDSAIFPEPDVLAADFTGKST